MKPSVCCSARDARSVLSVSVHRVWRQASIGSAAAVFEEHVALARGRGGKHAAAAPGAR